MTPHMRWLWAARVLVYGTALVTLCLGLSRPFWGMHSWRMTQNAMVARNVARGSLDPTVTVLDLDGGGLLYGANLPALSWPAGVAWRVLGGEPAAVPRLLTLLATLIAAVLLERLGRHIAGRWAGLVAAAVFLQAPLIVGYGASFLEDMVMLAALGLAVDRAVAWSSRPRWRDATLVALGVALTVAIKLPAGAVVVPTVVVAAALGPRRWRALLHPQLVAALVAGVVLGLAYYGGLWLRVGSHPHFAWAFTWEPGTDKWGSLATLTDLDTSVLLYKRVTQEIVGVSGAIGVVAGLVVSLRNPRALLAVGWLAAVGAYMVIALGGHLAHDYYQLVLVQPLALLVACCFASPGTDRPRAVPAWAVARARWIAPAVGVAILLGMAVELQPFRTFLKVWQDPRWGVLAGAVAQVTAPEELVLAIDHSRPEVLYYADRRGYHLNPREATVANIEDRIERGVRTISVLEPQRLPVMQDAALAAILGDWRVVSLDEHHLVLRAPADP